ncbi:MAG TPA: serine/threonine-protein kinase, partial [Ktedonobacterales bacterium]|nr:serine/threonine-protein kinase [Ktedonobacterales bacterium]
MLARQTARRLVGAAIGRYVPQQLMEANELSALFIANGQEAGSSYLLRTLPLAPGAPLSQGPTGLLQQFQASAGPLAHLQHPYILPLVDLGVAGELPYLVWPLVPTRPLSARLGQNVSLDLLTIGRYLDQLAAALEYAHEHGVLHGNLAPDGVYIQRDGRLLVADFGVRPLLDTLRQDTQWHYLYTVADPYPPEQALGRPAGTYTDVYALGALLYQLLTGRPVFTGQTREEVAHEHLHSPVLPVSFWRNGLPLQLDALLATALAKEPRERFQHAGELANTYHQIVSPGDASRVPFVVGGPSARGPRSGRLAPGGLLDSSPLSGPLGPATDIGHPPLPAPSPAAGRQAFPRDGAGPAGSRGTPRRTGGRGRAVALIALIVVLLTGGGLALRSFAGPSGPASGQVVFGDSGSGPAGSTNALSVTISNLAAPPAQSHYAAWLLDTHTEHVLPLGQLTRHNDSYTLAFHSAQGPDGAPVNLLTQGDTIEITVETTQVNAPGGKVVLSGTFPPKTFVHIGHILFSFPTTPGQIGLLVGSLRQTGALDGQAQALLTAAHGGNLVAVQCYAQNVVNIIEGSKGADYRRLGAACKDQQIEAAGDGYGLVGTGANYADGTGGYLAGAAQHASLAVNQPDATAAVKTHAQPVEIALTNVTGWVRDALEAAEELVRTPTDAPRAEALAALTSKA